MAAIKDRSLYDQIFPINSFRRFILDQLVIWTLFLSYYLLIIFSVLGLLYLTGSLVPFFQLILGYLDEPMIQPEIAFLAILLTIVNGLIVLASPPLIFVLIVQYLDYLKEDYLKWSSEHGKEEENKKEEDELEVELARWRNAYNYILPPSSIQRYLAITFFGYFKVIFIAWIYYKLTIYIGYSIFTDEFSRSITRHCNSYRCIHRGWHEDLIAWSFGISIQFMISVIMAPICLFLYHAIYLPCRKSWTQYKTKIVDTTKIE